MFTSIRQSLGRLSPTKPSLDLIDQDHTGRDMICNSQDTTLDMGDEQQWEPSIWGRLEVINKKGKIQGTLPIVERECTIGRASDNDLRCCEIGISRHACKIVFDQPESARLVLLGSNRVILNDQVISPTAHDTTGEPPSQVLATNDLIQLQKYSFRFIYQEQSMSSAVFVPSSPSQSASMNTPNGKHRRVRMSLVHSADIETPDKHRARQPIQQNEEDEAGANCNDPSSHVSVDSSPTSVKAKRRVSLFAPGDAEATNNQAQAVASPTAAVAEFLAKGADLDEINKRGRQSIAVAPSTPPQHRVGAIPQSEPHSHRIMSADISLLFSDNGVRVMDGSKGLDCSSPRSYSPQVVSHEEPQDNEEIFDEVIVLDDQLEADDQAASSESPSSSKQEFAAPSQGLEIRDRESPSKPRRRSSILERVWPFGSPARSTETNFAAETQCERDAQTWPEAADAEEDRNSSGNLEEEAEVDGVQDLETNQEPRLGLGFNSPSRLPSSPSFLLDGRRKVSLRTRTLLKSSAVLAEKLEAEAELGIREPAIAEEAPEPSGLAQLAEPFALRSESDPRQKTGEDADPSEQDHMPASVHDDEDEDEVERSLTTSEDQVPELASQPRTSAYKRMSLPSSSVAARRFSLFGGLPKLRSANEAEQVGDTSRAERMGHARRKSSFEPSAMNGDLLRAPRDPSLSEAAYAQLRMPARDALRYLLSNKPTSITSPKPEEPVTTPVLQSGSFPAQDSPKTPATPKYEGLRELRLGRPDGVDGLEKSRGPKRRSLMLSPQVSSSLASQTAPTPATSSPVTREPVTLARTADLTFLRHAMAMPEEDIEGDAYLKGLRYVFKDYKDVLSRDRFEHEDSAQVSALATLLSSPAAHRALLGAAASVGRLSPHETAIQTAALAHKHKKTRRGCRGGRKRSKSHSGTMAGEENGDGEDNNTSSSRRALVPPLEALELNGQEDDGPDSAEVQQVQEIQNLLNRLGPLAINNVPGTDVAAEEQGRDQAKEWDQPAANDRRKSWTANGAAAHHRKSSTASNLSDASSHGSQGKRLQARLSSWNDGEGAEAASVAGPQDGRPSSRTRQPHRDHQNRIAQEAKSSSEKMDAKDSSSAHDGGQENTPTTRSRAPRGGPPSSTAPSTNGRASRHTRGQSSDLPLEESNRDGYKSASENVQRSPVRPNASGNRGGRKGPNASKAPAANTRSNARAARSNGNRFPKGGYLASDGPSSDFPEGPQSEPAFGTNDAESGTTGPTTRLRSGRIVRGVR